jgi:capsular exopolysaccharide synthesis family protein
MSRIHEALKKAEHERASTQAAATDIDAPPQEPVTEASVWKDEAPGIRANVISQTAVVAALPPEQLRFDDLRRHCAHPQWQLVPNMNVFMNANLNAHGAEQFRTLRSRLYQLRGSQPLRTILVTSSLAGEGKTFVTSNLAQAIVRQPDRRALIIDADLRRSHLHVPLGAPSAPGLTDYLRGEADEMTVIQHGDEGDLCFIAGGNEVANPSELLSNGRLKTLLERVTPIFDWIILDSPPCIPVADASVLAELCDGILMVVRAGVTPSEAAQKACQELRKRNVLGVVLNAMKESDEYGTYHYYGYGYGRHKSKDSLPK